MKLTVLERINLLGILPRESNYVTFRILNDLKKELSFSEKEIKDFKIIQKYKEDGTGAQVFWDSKKEKEKEIVIGPQALIIINTALQKVDKDGKVNDENITLFDKFQPEIGLKVEK